MRKQCRRKIYKLVDPISFAMNGARTMNPNELTNLRLRELASLESIIKGTGTKQDWCELMGCLNLTEVMAMNGIGPEAMDSCLVAQDALEEAAHRYKATGKMGLSGTGIKALRDVIEYAALQQTSISRSQFEKMLDKTLYMIRGRGNQVKVIS